MTGWTAEVGPLGALAPEARRRLDAFAVNRVPKGSVLFQPGDAVQGYVIVLEGRIAVHLVGATGRDILLYDVTPGKSCIQSTLGLLGGEDYSAEAVAQTDARIVLLPKEAFLDLLGNSPEFRAMVFAAFAERMQSLMQVLERVAFQKVEARLAAYILAQADATGQVSMTQQDLARAIGSAREVVSRRLDAMARGGLVAVERGKLKVLDAGALKRMSESMSV